MKVRHILFVFTVNFFLLFGLATKVRAIEGTAEVRSTTGENYRCYAASMFVGGLKILVGCRGLVYPSPGAYIMWAIPLDDTKPIKLGNLDLGQKQFSINKPFTSLFVTLESNPGTRSPSDVVIMRGTVEPLTFLKEQTAPEPTPKEETPEGGEAKEEEGGEQKEEKSTSTKDKLLTALKRAGVAALFALVALVGLVFVITRARG